MNHKAVINLIITNSRGKPLKLPQTVEKTSNSSLPVNRLSIFGALNL